MRAAAGLASLLLLALAQGGCAVVSPWERDVLARSDMAWDPVPLASTLDKHIQFSKEGALPGSSSGGGGCGCN